MRSKVLVNLGCAAVVRFISGVNASATHPTATPQITIRGSTRDHNRYHVWQPSMPQNMFSLAYGHVGRN
jgi:hypothetical protein